MSRSTRRTMEPWNDEVKSAVASGKLKSDVVRKLIESDASIRMVKAALVQISSERKTITTPALVDGPAQTLHWTEDARCADLLLQSWNKHRQPLTSRVMARISPPPANECNVLTAMRERIA